MIIANCSNAKANMCIGGMTLLACAVQVGFLNNMERGDRGMALLLTRPVNDTPYPPVFRHFDKSLVGQLVARVVSVVR